MFFIVIMFKLIVMTSEVNYVSLVGLARPVGLCAAVMRRGVKPMVNDLLIIFNAIFLRAAVMRPWRVLKV